MCSGVVRTAAENVSDALAAGKSQFKLNGIRRSLTWNALCDTNPEVHKDSLLLVCFEVAGADVSTESAGQSI